MTRDHAAAIMLWTTLACAAMAGCVPPGAPDPAGRAPQIPTDQPPSQPASVRDQPWIGAEFAPIDPPTARLPTRVAARVHLVFPGGPAEAAGLREGDLVTGMGEATSSETLSNLVLRTRVGSTLTGIAIRDGQQRNFSLVVAQTPADFVNNGNTLVSQRIAEEHDAGRRSDTAGNPREAIRHYVRAMQLFLRAAEPARNDATWYELATGIAHVLPAVRPIPEIPAQARFRSARGFAILKDATGDDGFGRAAEEFRNAIYEAPWVPDAYFNYGSVAEKAGATENAIMSLRTYLILNNRAADAAAIREKIAELEIIADERRRWLPFTGLHLVQGRLEVVTLRNRNMTVTAVLLQGQNPQSTFQTNQVIFSGAIKGGEFQGNWHNLTTTPAAQRCLGADRAAAPPARGGIDIQGKTLRMEVFNVSFNASTCQIVKQEWEGWRIYHEGTR